MDFDFSDDQLQLQDAVRKWVDKGYPFERRRAAVAAGGFDRAAYTELAELGLTALTIPEAHGGLGQGAIDAMVVMQELGRGMVLEPLAQTYIASKVLCQFASPDVQATWLPRIASGDALVVLAHQERKSRYQLANFESKSALPLIPYSIDAIKFIVPAGDQANAYLVPAMLQGQLALFLVERASSGVSTTGYRLQDGSRAADLHLHGAPATLITTDGQAALELAVDTGIAAVCAEAVGTMDQAFALTASYLNQRKQFGVPIASFQALRHRVADMKMQLELARSMSYYASLKLDAPASERRQAMARAKVQLGQSMRYVGQQMVQLHGGIGVTDEYIGSHYFKKLTQLEMTYGDTLHRLGEVSERMQESAGAFA